MPGSAAPPTSRRLEIPAARLVRWVDGFAARHGPVTVSGTPDTVTVHAADGAVAVLHVPFAPLPQAAAGAEPVPELAAHAALPRPLLVLLVRRGGFACVVLDDGRVTASRTGRRHVQGRTAAGGWSQQRFARRREGQTRVLVEACAGVAERVLLPAVTPARTLVTGGDRALVEAVLAEPRLRRLAELGIGRRLTVGDPRADVVRALPERLTAVEVTLSEPAG